MLQTSLLDPAGPTVRLWDTLDRALVQGEATHPMNVAGLRASAISHPEHHAVLAAADAFRPYLRDAMAMHKHAVEALMPTEVANCEDLDVRAFLHSQGVEVESVTDDEVRADCERVMQEVRSRWDANSARLTKFEKGASVL